MTTLWEAMKITARKTLDLFKFITWKRVKSVFIFLACGTWIIMPFIFLFSGKVTLPISSALNTMFGIVVIFSWCMYWMNVFIEWRL